MLRLEHGWAAAAAASCWPASDSTLWKRAEGSLREASRLYGKWTIESRPKVLESNRGGQLDELRRREVLLELTKEVFGYVRWSPRHRHSDVEDEFLDLCEGIAVLVAGEMLQLGL